MVTKRESQTVAIPVSEVKTASSAAYASTAAASASGRISWSRLSRAARSFPVQRRS
jgi:hypothetical protein